MPLTAVGLPGGASHACLRRNVVDLLKFRTFDLVTAPWFVSVGTEYAGVAYALFIVSASSSLSTCAAIRAALSSRRWEVPPGGIREDSVMTSVSPKVDWHLLGDWFDVCSCKLPCPCSFAQEPTHGDCLFTLVWHVREGHFGVVDLAGLNVVSLGEFTGNMWVEDPNAKMKLMFYIDATADPDQRDALERIFTGREGGWPAQFASLIQELRGIESAPIEFDVAEDLRYWRAEIPGKVDLRVAALTGPTSDPDRRVTTANAPGAEVGPGQVATWGVVERDYARGFDWSREYRGGSSKHFAFDWRPGTNEAPLAHRQSVCRCPA